MKCIRNLSNNEVKRVRDEQAEHMVDNTNTWEFCPKSAWKALRTVPITQVTLTEGQTREIQRKADKKKGQQSKRDYRKS